MEQNLSITFIKAQPLNMQVLKFCMKKWEVHTSFLCGSPKPQDGWLGKLVGCERP